jgi:hypothetical protein
MAGLAQTIGRNGFKPMGLMQTVASNGLRPMGLAQVAYDEVRGKDKPAGEPSLSGGVAGMPAARRKSMATSTVLGEIPAAGRYR